MRHQLRSISGATAALLVLTSIANAGNGPKWPDDISNITPEGRSAIFFLMLYERGYAGGDTGICIDFDKKDMQNKLKVGFSTSAFGTGDDTQKTPYLKKEVAASLEKLMQTVSRAQNGKVKVNIKGYADGQHYPTAPAIKEFTSSSPLGMDVEKIRSLYGSDFQQNPLLYGSIEENRRLGERRANVVGKLFENSSYATVGEKLGLPSPLLEASDPSMKSGPDCPTRRKVVLDMDLPVPLIKVDANGNFTRFPETFTGNSENGKLGDASDRELTDLSVAKSLNGAMNDLAKRPGSLLAGKIETWNGGGPKNGTVVLKEKYLPSEEIPSGQDEIRVPKLTPSIEAIVQEIFDELVRQGKISPGCTQYPVKQFTLAFIHSQIDREAYVAPHGPGQVRNRTNDTTRFIKLYTDKGVPPGQKPITLTSGGVPSNLIACFVPDIETQKIIASRPGRLVSGTDILSAATKRIGENSKSAGVTPSSMKIGFDPENLTAQKIDVYDKHSHELLTPGDHKGLFCTACGQGHEYVKTDKGTFRQEEHNRLVLDAYDKKLTEEEKEKSKADLMLLQKANVAITNATPGAFAGYQRPIEYIVRNCPKCQCDVVSKIRNKDKDVDTIDPLVEGQKASYLRELSAADLSNACFNTNAYQHTCGFQPSSYTDQSDPFKNGLNTHLEFFDPTDPDIVSPAMLEASSLGGLQTQLEEIGKRRCEAEGKEPPKVPKSIQEKINTVACAGDPETQLPTDDEMADCVPKGKSGS